MMSSQNDVSQQPSPQPTVEQPPVSPKSPFEQKTFLVVLGLLIFIIFVLTIYLLVSTFKFTNQISPTQTSAEGRFCGGIAANLPENQCPTGYTCKLDSNYPDASGKCAKNK